MAFNPEELPPGCPPLFQDAVGGSDVWQAMYRHPCTFGPDIFTDKMMNLILNPNLNSSWLFRADILYDDQDQSSAAVGGDNVGPVLRDVLDMTRQRTLVRRLIPRNEKRDQPLEQTCSFHQSESPETKLLSTLVIYIPHASSSADLPFYHPKVQGIAHLHEWDQAAQSGSVSVHFLAYPEIPIKDDTRLQRTAYHLLELLHKHGRAEAAGGYTKRVHHDQIVPRSRFQDRYALLKSKYARRLVESWAESTDPTKHVFEDLGIAAFLIELWADMYGAKDDSDGTNSATSFPGFIDIGCGNGLLVYILTQEGYHGWGFDARLRKSWAQYTTPTTLSPSGSSLEERLLLPSVAVPSTPTDTDSSENPIPACNIHNGAFPKGTFIISNHADELTPWTPILATLSECPFIMIPCCSHKLTGERFRASPPRDKSKGKSTYASLVDWVMQIAEDCSWEVEIEMLRIPSTRNTCLLGRKRNQQAPQDAQGSADGLDIQAILTKYGGVQGYYDNVAKLVKSGPRCH